MAQRMHKGCLLGGGSGNRYCMRCSFTTYQKLLTRMVTRALWCSALSFTDGLQQTRMPSDVVKAGGCRTMSFNNLATKTPVKQHGSDNAWLSNACGNFVLRLSTSNSQICCRCIILKYVCRSVAIGARCRADRQRPNGIGHVFSCSHPAIAF